MSIKPDFSTEIILKPSDGVSIEIEASVANVSLAGSSVMMYTWALLPSYIRVGEGEAILNMLYGAKAMYNHEELQVVLDGLFADNKMRHTGVIKDHSNLQQYGDFYLYAQSIGQHFLNLYVFCAGVFNLMPVGNKAQILFDGVDISADWQPPTDEADK